MEGEIGPSCDGHKPGTTHLSLGLELWVIGNFYLWRTGFPHADDTQFLLPGESAMSGRAHEQQL